MTVSRTFYYTFALLLSMSLSCAACAALDQEARSDSGRLLVGKGVPVSVAGETQAVGTRGADAADDPEIWVDRADPRRAVIFGTDKQAGLYLYGLDGKVLQFLAEGRLNNVDLREGFATAIGERVLVAASHRDRLGAALYLFDPATLRASPWGLIAMDLKEPYGLCMGRRGADFIVIVNSTDGQVRQVKVQAGPNGNPMAVEERRFALASQTEGCVVDDAGGWLFIGEEARGIWRYPLDPAVGSAGVLVAAAPSAELQPDVEGLTILRDTGATYLIASSQGDSAFAVYRLDGGALRFVGRFSGVAANGVDNVTGTDGVAAVGGTVGSFRDGLIVAQDDVDTEGETTATSRSQQNFKLIGWSEVKLALGL